jgi:transposase
VGQHAGRGVERQKFRRSEKSGADHHHNTGSGIDNFLPIDVPQAPNRMAGGRACTRPAARWWGMRKGEQPPWIVPDELWARIEPLLPAHPRRHRNPGRKRIPDHQVLCGILFVLHTGIQWEFPPQQPGFGSGMTCWRRLAEWNAAGVWARLHAVLLAELHAADKLDRSRTVIDSARVRAARRGPKAGPARSTAADPARTTTCWPRAGALRWPSR